MRIGRWIFVECKMRILEGGGEVKSCENPSKREVEFVGFGRSRHRQSRSGGTASLNIDQNKRDGHCPTTITTSQLDLRNSWTLFNHVQLVVAYWICSSRPCTLLDPLFTRDSPFDKHHQDGGLAREGCACWFGAMGAE